MYLIYRFIYILTHIIRLMFLYNINAIFYNQNKILISIVDNVKHIHIFYVLNFLWGRKKIKKKYLPRYCRNDQFILINRYKSLLNIFIDMLSRSTWFISACFIIMFYKLFPSDYWMSSHILSAWLRKFFVSCTSSGIINDLMK